MKFGEHLKESIEPEYGPDPYIDYSKLDDIIRDLSEKAPARYVMICVKQDTAARPMGFVVASTVLPCLLCH